jgi:hypothetical protein
VEVWQHVEERVEELCEAVEDLRLQVDMIKQHASLQDATTAPRMPEAEDADQNKSNLSTPPPELRIGPSGWSPFCSRSLGTGLRLMTIVRASVTSMFDSAKTSLMAFGSNDRKFRTASHSSMSSFTNHLVKLYFPVFEGEHPQFWEKMM